MEELHEGMCGSHVMGELCHIGWSRLANIGNLERKMLILSSDDSRF